MAVYHTEKEFWHAFERYNALSSPKYHWHTSQSDALHRCEFGCDIPDNDTHFKKPLDSEGESAVHVCWPCMERLVYLTVDADHHTRELTSHLRYQQYHQRKRNHAIV